MAIHASVQPLSSQLCLSRSWICFTHRQLKPLRRTIPTPRRKYVAALPINVDMTLITAVYSEDAGDNALQSRRIGNHHFNLWDDHFIQSLSTPYGVGNSSYIHFHFNVFTAYSLFHS